MSAEFLTEVMYSMYNAKLIRNNIYKKFSWRLLSQWVHKALKYTKCSFDEECDVSTGIGI